MTVGVVLAAGTGRRLRPYTDELPKGLVPLPGDTTPIDVILGNFAASGVTDVALVVGFAASAVKERQADLESRHGVTLELIHNDKATTWNNCYTLWCARDLFTQDVLLANSDTVHPIDVENVLLENVGSPLVLAVDAVKTLGDEEMKLTWSSDRGVEQITKLMDPAKAYGEYIGVCLIRSPVANALADALEATWRRDPNLYYEDGFQELINRGDRIDVAPIGDLPWIEIDNHDDLARAEEVLAAINARQI